jgi:hypothetical protein
VLNNSVPTVSTAERRHSNSIGRSVASLKPAVSRVVPLSTRGPACSFRMAGMSHSMWCVATCFNFTRSQQGAYSKSGSPMMLPSSDSNKHRCDMVSLPTALPMPFRRAGVAFSMSSPGIRNPERTRDLTAV